MKFEITEDFPFFHRRFYLLYYSSMVQHIPEEIIDIIKKFGQAGFEIHLVGGCVRNILMKKKVEDWDFTTNATPEEILQLYKEGFYDNKFGTVGIPHERLGVIEITTYRTEHGYVDRRRPKEVRWGKSIEEDLARRDFTINAIALRPAKGLAQGKPSDVAIIDPFGGQEDIKKKLIRAVGNPEERFKEDALRLMRAIRFATQLSFTIEDKTWTAIVNDAKLIEEISKERVRDELLKILASDYPYDGTMLLRNATLLDHILPELLEGVDVSQVRPGRHHTTDVFTHNLLALKFCPSKDPIVRFATLLHDIGKPSVAGTDEQGLVIFHNHEIIGSRMVRDICDRLHFSKKDREKVVTLVRWHMYTVDAKITDAAVRRFIRRVGVANIRDMVDLRIGDRLGSGTAKAESWRLKLFKKRIEEQLKPAPFSINDMAIDGNDVMKELNIKPGLKVGKILQKLFEEVDEDLSKNNRGYLLKRIKELAKV